MTMMKTERQITRISLETLRSERSGLFYLHKPINLVEGIGFELTKLQMEIFENAIFYRMISPNHEARVQTILRQERQQKLNQCSETNAFWAVHFASIRTPFVKMYKALFGFESLHLLC